MPTSAGDGNGFARATAGTRGAGRGGVAGRAGAGRGAKTESGLRKNG